VLDISWKVIGVGQLCVLFFSGSLIRGSYVCIVSVFLNIPSFHSTYICLYNMYVASYIYILHYRCH
jgi:hypothetical protein